MLSYPLHNPPSLFVVAASDHAVHVILSLFTQLFFAIEFIVGHGVVEEQCFSIN